MMQAFRTYRYELIAALAGSAIMILELVGARTMAPFFGTSTYVWTAVIGIILGALSFGYWYGGKLADKEASDKGLAILLAAAGLVVGISLLLQQIILSNVAALSLDVRASAIIASLLLLAPASALLGIVSPYVARLRLRSLETAGASIGRLYAAGTIGSIVGTFAAGYWLIALFGNFKLGIIVVGLLLAVSFIADMRFAWYIRIIGAAVLMVILSIASGYVNRSSIIGDIDSSYARYQVVETKSPTGIKTHYLIMDNIGAQSGVIVGREDELIFEYTRGFKDILNSYGSTDNVAVIGGGAYTFPSVIARERPQTTVDVIEIDPALDDIAAEYFGYVPQSNLHLIHEDGRVFLNQNHTQYDVLYIDAFSSLTPPYQLTTRQAAVRMKESLKNNGILAVNIIAAPDASDSYFLATVATYRAVFGDMAILRVQPEIKPSLRQNLLFVMGNKANVDKIKVLPYQTALPLQGGMILTDDHAPIEQLIEASGGI